MNKRQKLWLENYYFYGWLMNVNTFIILGIISYIYNKFLMAALFVLAYLFSLVVLFKIKKDILKLLK